MIVVDSTVLGDLLFNGGKLRESALELQEMDPDWIGVQLVRYELGNIAWKYGKFLGMDLGALWVGLSGADTVLNEIVIDVDWRTILELSLADGLTYYDASHVWLARTRGLKLRTRDKEVLVKCPDVAVEMP